MPRVNGPLANFRPPAVTMQKYSRAWELFQTGHTVAAIMTAVGISRTQMEWLVRVGDEEQEMPSFASRAADISARLRKQDAEIARIASEGAVEWAEHRRDLSIQSTKLAKGLTSALGAIMAAVAPRMIAGTLTPDDLVTLKATTAIRDSLKALSPLTDYGAVTDLVKALQYSPHAVQDPSRQVALNLAPESQMPANLAMIESVLGPQEASHDPLADLLPEFTQWTDEEQAHFAMTGERPARVASGEWKESEPETPIAGHDSSPVGLGQDEDDA